MQCLYICPIHVRYMHEKSVFKEKTKDKEQLALQRDSVAFRISTYSHGLLTKLAEAEQRNKIQELDVVLSEKYESLKKEGKVS
jgi:hypothetical protein